MPDTALTASPFHKGEIAIQTRMGVAERVGRMGRKVIRDHMLDQHRDFYAGLPFVLLGTVDGNGRPWASLIGGGQGVLETPDDRTLAIKALPDPRDPARGAVSVGADIGLLGIELGTRRRNRLTGQVSRADSTGIEIAVRQSFGNCPKYIQTRTLIPADPPADPPAALPPASVSSHLDGAAKELITASDTLFIASAFRTDTGAISQGADVSHRGGKPGFVKVLDNRTIAFPDFPGNNMYNTIGNLSVNPRAGILFVDFDSGDLLTMTGTTEIIADAPALFEGAQHVIRLGIDEVRHLPAGLAFRAAFDAYSPHLAATGEWTGTAS